MQHIVSSWRRSRRAGLSPKRLEPLCSQPAAASRALKSHSRTAENAAFCFFLFVCVSAGTLLGRCSASTHTHTHSTVDLQLGGSGCSLEPHTNIPHSPSAALRLPDPLTHTVLCRRRFFSHSACRPQIPLNESLRLKFRASLPAGWDNPSGSLLPLQSGMFSEIKWSWNDSRTPLKRAQ